MRELSISTGRASDDGHHDSQHEANSRERNDRETWEGRGFLDDFIALAQSHPDRVFATFEGHETTFAELDRQSDAFARWCVSAGLGAGSRIAVMMNTSPAHFAVLLGIAKAGVVWVPVNTRQRGEGLRFLLVRSGAAAFVIEDELVAEVSVVAPRGVPIMSAAELGEVLAQDGGFPVSLPHPSQLFAISYTSGTTGRPKGVPITHAMLRYAGEAAARVADLGDDSILLMWEPLHHIGGAQLLVVPLIRNARLAMLPRFSASGFWDAARASRATHIHYLGGVLQILLKQPPSALDRQHQVRIAWGGGCAADIWRAFEERFGVVIRECYGMTETSSIATCNGERAVGAVGRPMPWFEVELRDPQTGEPAKRGEIIVRAKHEGPLFSGYIDEPEATARALRNGVLHTGDIGSFDYEGRLCFHGRQTDSVRVSGENVSSWEVERVVNAHPKVEDSAMIGVAAEIGEADIKLFVQPKEGAELDPAELWSWLSSRLARYQMPRYIALTDGFPRTASERIMKHQLDTSTDRCWTPA